MFNSSKERHIQTDLVARGIRDTRVLQAFRDVPREIFVPESLADQTYDDRPLPIGCGQTISQPYIVALMSELLELDEQDSVLEVGTGSGYQTAILARLCARVYTIEVVEELHTSASRRLEQLGYTNIWLKLNDGYWGWPEYAPFNGIIVTCAPDHVPNPLLEQLAPKGRMVIPIGYERGIQELILIEKTDGNYRHRSVIPVAFVPLVRPIKPGDKLSGL